MKKEKIKIEGTLLEVASYSNYKEATILVSVLDQPDLANRIIPEEAGEEYYSTLIGYPLLAHLKKNIFGKPQDFGGHEMSEIIDENGKKKKKFNTIAIGSIVDAWIEERELDEYEGGQKCILCKAKLWTSRYPEYFNVFDKLWNNGKLSTSWELTATDVEEDENGNKIYKVFEYIGLALLGSAKTPCVPGSGVLQYAEVEENYEAELAEALEKDIANLDIENKEMEEKELQKDNENKNVNIAEENIGSTIVEDVAENVTEEPVQNNKENNTEIASLTDYDLFRKIAKACKDKTDCNWGYISYWFPEEHTVWYKTDNAESDLDYKLFTYTVENDEVTVSEPKDVKLTVSLTEVETVLAEKDEKIGTLTAELDIKNQAVITASKKINELNVQVSELIPYKEKVEIAEREKIETEIAEEKKELKSNLLKTNLFTEEEIAQAEIAELIESRDKTGINNLIANRYIASLETENNEKDIEESTSVASLESDDINESPADFMKNLLKRK